VASGLTVTTSQPLVFRIDVTFMVGPSSLVRRDWPGAHRLALPPRSEFYPLETGDAGPRLPRASRATSIRTALDFRCRRHHGGARRSRSALRPTMCRAGGFRTSGSART